MITRSDSSSIGTAQSRVSPSTRSSSRGFASSLNYASSTINLRLAAVRRLAYEAADAGLLSPDLAAGIRRVKGAKKHGMRIGNWLTAEQGRALLSTFDRSSLRGKRDYAMAAILLGCGLRRAELAAAQVEDLQQREEHWVFADLIGKGGHIRTVPIPDRVAEAVRVLLTEAGLTEGAVFRAINKAGRVARHGFSPKVIWGGCKTNCGTLRTGECCGARPSPHMRAFMSSSGRRTRTDSILARAHQCPNDRTVSRLQTAREECRERQPSALSPNPNSRCKGTYGF